MLTGDLLGTVEHTSGGVWVCQCLGHLPALLTCHEEESGVLCHTPQPQCSSLEAAGQGLNPWSHDPNEAWPPLNDVCQLPYPRNGRSNVVQIHVPKAQSALSSAFLGGYHTSSYCVGE